MSERRELTRSDVAAVLGVKPKDLEYWCDTKVLKAVAGGKGYGNHRRFTVPQVLGLGVGLQLRKTERGCTLAYVSQIVDAFGSMTETELEREFTNGGTHFIMVLHGKPVLGGPQYPEWPDVQAIYRRMMAKIAELEAGFRALRPGCGRPTGLAYTAKS